MPHVRLLERKGASRGPAARRPGCSSDSRQRYHDACGPACYMRPRLLLHVWMAITHFCAPCCTLAVHWNLDESPVPVSFLPFIATHCMLTIQHYASEPAPSLRPARCAPRVLSCVAIASAGCREPACIGPDKLLPGVDGPRCRRCARLCSCRVCSLGSSEVGANSSSCPLSKELVLMTNCCAMKHTRLTMLLSSSCCGHVSVCLAAPGCVGLRLRTSARAP